MGSPNLHAKTTIQSADSNSLTSVSGSSLITRSTLRLKVSDNGHFLTDMEGRPFFYLADTAWELFHRLDREAADRYLADRASKGFTVIQAAALAELDGLGTPNAYGHLPRSKHDPNRAWVVGDECSEYWEHVDYIIEGANRCGLLVALLPTWGDKWHKSWGVGPVVFNAENARQYGEWIGRRFRDRGIIWVLGGDRAFENDEQKVVITKMAEGIKKGDGGAHLITFHPPGPRGSSEWWHGADWLDFNMRQNGHSPEYTAYHNTFLDYQRVPPKPVIDGEPIYEGHPVDFKASALGHSVAADIRRALYWDLFNGACGFSYGHHSIWQMFEMGKYPVNAPLMDWSDALNEPGATQMRYGRWLIESRPILTRVPDPELIKEKIPASAWPGQGRYRFTGTRDSSGSYAMIYAPAGRKFIANLSSLTGATLRSWWFNPRDGTARIEQEFPKTLEKEFDSPTPGELLDWVLVIDDASKGFPPPGQCDS